MFEFLHGNIDQRLVKSLLRLLDFEIGGLHVFLLQQSIEHVYIVYTCYTYLAMRWSM